MDDRSQHQHSNRTPILAPIVGRVAAGNFTFAAEDPLGYIEVQDIKAPARELFGLQVEGDSMQDADICDGDVVVVHRREHANSGEIVIARVGDEATLKILRKRSGMVELHPANRQYAPIIVRDPETFGILGKVIATYRRDDARVSMNDDIPGAH